MHKLTTTTALLALATATAGHAGGVERSKQSVGILFEEGNRAELSFGYVSPDVSGVQQITAGATSPAGASSGNMSEDYSTLAFGLKQQVNDQVALALIVDQPIGADVFYRPDTGYLYGGSSLAFGGSVAEIDAVAVTALAKYTTPTNISVFGGVRAEQAAGNVALFNGYQMQTSTEVDYGYVLGAAYERPDIALRVALTYNSEITHDFAATEVTGAGAVQTGFSTTVPQSVNLEAQTGVAPDTLLFGSIRWVDWTAFDITPTAYAAGSGGEALVDYEDDTFTYSLGLGRRFNENWSGAVLASYEPDHGGFSGNLGPTDGQTSLGVALTYETGAYEITGGVRYVSIGDAETQTPSALGAPAGTTFGDFNDNHAIAGGLQVAIKF